MKYLSDIDISLEDINKKLPKLPKKLIKYVVKFLPYVILIFGILNVMYIWSIWRWAHIKNVLVNSVNQSNNLYGSTAIIGKRISLTLYIALSLLVINTILYLSSVLLLRKKTKKGWDILFYALLINILYGLVIMFTSYGNNFSFIEYLIISSIGFYFLYQIKKSYKDPRDNKFKIKK